MKYIISIILIIHSVRTLLIYPPEFPLLSDTELSIQIAKEAFSLACVKTWKLLSAIQIQSTETFPVELFAVQDDPQFKIIIKCSRNLKSMNVTFLAPNCEPMYDGLVENPIIFQINLSKPNSSEVHFKLISSCIFSESNTSLINTANIGHDNGSTWYLVHRSILDPVKNTVKFGLIVFGQKLDGTNYREDLNSALNHASTTFFNRKLRGFVPYNIFKIHVDCALSSCYHANPNYSRLTPFTKAPNDQHEKIQRNDTEILILLLIPVIIGLILFGMIIFYCGRP